MKKNVASQVVTAMMRTTLAAITSVVSTIARTSCTSTNTNASPIVVTTASAQSHGMIPGTRVVISGSSQSNVNGNWVVLTVPTVSSFTIGDWTNGAVQNGNGGSTGTGATVTPYHVNVYVSKDGGAPVTGTGTLTHIGKGPLNIDHTADANALRSAAATLAPTVTAVGNTAVTLASGNIASATYGLWKYVPTQDETNADQVTFTFTSPALNTISVSQMFEPVTSSSGLQSVNVATWNGLTTVALPLTPTVAGRTLDVTATGEAGIDWANIGAPGTSVSLSQTKIGLLDNIIQDSLFTTNNSQIYSLGIIDQGTAQSATTTTLVLRSAATFSDDEIIGARILITGGSTGVGQSRVITDYVSATDTATVDAWATNPSGTITYKIFSATSGGGGGLDAAGVRSAVGLASANLDTQLTAIDDLLDTEVAAIKTKTDFLPSATAGSAGGLFIAGTNADTTANITGNLTGNVSGSVGSVTTVNGLAAGVITAASIAANAITDAAVASDVTIASVTGSVGSVTGLTASDVAAIKAKTDNLPAAPASTTNITAGTITTVTNLTNAPTAGDLTATMKTSVTTAATAATPTVLLTNGTGTGQISLSSGKVALSNPCGLQKNVAVSAFTFFLKLASDHASPATGKTVTAQRSLDGAAFLNCANAVTEIGNGFYSIDLAAGDVNGDIVALKFTAAATDQLSVTIVTEP